MKNRWIETFRVMSKNVCNLAPQTYTCMYVVGRQSCFLVVEGGVSVAESAYLRVLARQAYVDAFQ